MLIVLAISVFFSLYLMIKGVEYRESIERLNEQVAELKEANQNLANIIQEDNEQKTNHLYCGTYEGM